MSPLRFSIPFISYPSLSKVTTITGFKYYIQMNNIKFLGTNYNTKFKVVVVSNLLTWKRGTFCSPYLRLKLVCALIYIFTIYIFIPFYLKELSCHIKRVVRLFKLLLH